MLTTADILPNDQYVPQRQRFLSDAIAAKQVRQLLLGEHIQFLFENTVTMRFQIQEMCRIEGITDDKGVAHEVKTYAPMATGGGVLRATVLIQYEDPAERDRELARLLGLHEHLHLRLGELDPIAVQFDEEQFNDKRLSSVQFVQIPLDDAAVAALGDLSAPAALVSTHPAYAAEVPLPGPLRAALLDDLRGS